MKGLTCLFILALIVMSGCIQTRTQWAVTFEEEENTTGYSIIPTEGGFVVAGSIGPPDARDFWLVKVDGEGNKVWSHQFGNGTDDDRAYDVVEADGGYVVVGISQTPHDVRYSFLMVVKTTHNGEKEWSKMYQLGNKYTAGTSILPVEDGYIIAGTVGGKEITQRLFEPYAFLMKMDRKGEKQWLMTYDRTMTSVTQIARFEGGYLMLGSISGDKPFEGAVWLQKVDEHGEPQWEKSYTRFGHDTGRCLTVMEDGLLIGAQSSNDLWIIRTDLGGDILWSHVYDQSFDDITNVVQIQDQFIIVGNTYAFHFRKGIVLRDAEDFLSMFGQQDILIIRTDTDKREKWRVVRGCPEGDGVHDVCCVGDSIVMVGYTEEKGKMNLFIMKWKAIP